MGSCPHSITAMRLKLLVLLLPLVLQSATADDHFAFNGFKSVDLILDGMATFTLSSLLSLVNTTPEKTSHAFYPTPIHFKNSPTGSVLSFSTTFVFGIVPPYATFTLRGQGLAFVVAPQRGLPDGYPNLYLGLFNKHSNGNETNHVVAVEIDTRQNSDFNDMNDNHVGIDINGLKSVKAETAGYYVEKTHGFQNLSLMSGKAMQVWVEYDSSEKTMDVTIVPIGVEKPSKPLLS